MPELGIFGICILLATIAFSYQGFENMSFFNRYKFNVGAILNQKDYKRMLTSGFLHADWSHLLFNMFSFYSFASLLEFQLGIFNFALLYFASLLAGSTLSLYMNKNNWYYSAIGASGAVSGVIFAAIALFPDLKLSLFFIPIGIPSWLFGLLYIGYTVYGMRSNNDNIGHDAHLGGAITGLIIAVLLYPHALVENYLPISLSVVPIIVYVVYTRTNFSFLQKKPNMKVFRNTTSKTAQSLDDRYNEARANEQKEIDALLEKINRKGYDSLSEKERQTLARYSKNQKK
ncbi:Rhomboid family protein [Tenacibaculum litopenaei]|uniref:rhomboid family intramembrane serine protease n=1 Tax=Tenacibaculum litopenaei TaxID=396016 RepID=UPI0038963BAE